MHDNSGPGPHFSLSSSAFLQQRPLPAMRGVTQPSESPKVRNKAEEDSVFSQILIPMKQSLQWIKDQVHEEARLVKTFGLVRAAEELVFNSLTFDERREIQKDTGHTMLKSKDSFGRTAAHTACMQENIQQLEALHLVAPELSESTRISHVGQKVKTFCHLFQTGTMRCTSCWFFAVAQYTLGAR
jgi:hypothetical protein